MGDDSSHLRARLLDAALARLEAGEGEPSLRALARDVGVSAMAPYRHFPGKEALLEGAAARGFALLRDALLLADAAPDPAEALVSQGLAYLRFARGRPALFRLMFGGRGPANKGLPPGETAYGVLAARVATLSPRPEAVLACWASVHGLATLAIDGRHAVDERQTRRVLELIVSGLAES